MERGGILLPTYLNDSSFIGLHDGKDIVGDDNVIGNRRNLARETAEIAAERSEVL